MVLKILERFEKDDKVKYFKGYIALKNFTKYQKDNPSINKGMEILTIEVPSELLKWVKIDTKRIKLPENIIQTVTDCIETAPYPNPNPNNKHNTPDGGLLCESKTVETVETVDKSLKEACNPLKKRELEKEKLLTGYPQGKEIELKKEMLEGGSFKESFIDDLFKKYPVEKIEKYFEEFKYMQNIRNPAGWMTEALKNDYLDREEGG